MSKLGTIVSDFKKAAEAVKHFLITAGKDAPVVVQEIVKDEEALAPIIEAFIPQSTIAFTLANALLDKIAQAVEDAGEAASKNGLSVALDQQTVADVKAVIAAAKAIRATPAPATT
jgi:hypothetical protein